MASLYTDQGVELRVDDRLFALFAVLNAVGLDRGVEVRHQPVPRMAYPKERALVRARVLAAAPEVRQAAEAFLDAHPLPLARYVAQVLEAEPPAAPRGTASASLLGLDDLLAQAWARWGLEALSAEVAGAQRTALKAWLPIVDGPLGRAKVALGLQRTDVVLVGNLLDEPGAVRAVTGRSGRVYVLVGPMEQPQPERLIGALAQLQLEPVVARVVHHWAAGPVVLREAQAAGAKESSVTEYAVAALSTALALRAVEASEAQWEAAAAAGYFGSRDAARLLDDAKPLDGWALDAMHKLETRRPAKK